MVSPACMLPVRSVTQKPRDFEADGRGRFPSGSRRGILQGSQRGERRGDSGTSKVELLRHCRIALVGLVGLAAVACTKGVANTQPTPTPTATATPTPTPVPTPDVGTGDSGTIVVTADQIVNTCRVVVAQGAQQLAVNDATGFDAGGRVLVLQMQDDFSTSGITTAYDTADLAGGWEVVRIANVNGSILELETDLAGTYQTNAAAGETAQVCTMPEFTDVDVQATGRIVAAAWNGETGGVIAFYASGRVRIDGALAADGTGFRGGLPTTNNGTSGVTAEDTTNGEGGGKGEGMDGRSWLLAGRGSMGNAAGGGNAHNAGGGGGGNGGPGGGGCMQNIGQGNVPNTFGRAGGAVTIEPSTLLSLGGGGGAGQMNNDSAGAGGAGGGLILLIVNQLSGAGHIGADAVAGTLGNSDGAGGGGAGGTILIQTLSADFSGTVTALGGDGGNIQNSNADGPGGGGAGGRLELSADLISAATTEYSGGIRGENGGNNTAEPGAGGTLFIAKTIDSGAQ